VRHERLLKCFDGVEQKVAEGEELRRSAGCVSAETLFHAYAFE
jgi:hypothetical protein